MHRTLALPIALLVLGGCALGGCALGGSYEPTAAAPPPMVTEDAKLDDGAGLLGEQTAMEPADVTANRRLIRTANLRVVVPEYGPLQASLQAELAAAGGFIANTDLVHYAGSVGHAQLELRIPADRFADVLGWAEANLEVQELHVDTQDVTEQWVDVQARIDNGKNTEARLVGLLAEGTGSLEDVLAVERELARVRGEIESAEGRMRVLADQVGLATIQLSVTVQQPYEPAVETPYLASVGSAFSGSVGALIATAKGLGIALAALAPWAVVLFVLLAPVVLLGRRLVRRAMS
ncbi:MAG: DUF4349 domain-containing protein [Proteobacteria bacterium]|nr:DUF4349 domain-containing protein [Pseudomonadota bacterium]